MATADPCYKKTLCTADKIPYVTYKNEDGTHHVGGVVCGDKVPRPVDLGCGLPACYYKRTCNGDKDSRWMTQQQYGGVGCQGLNLCGTEAPKPLDCCPADPVCPDPACPPAPGPCPHPLPGECDEGWLDIGTTQSQAQVQARTNVTHHYQAPTQAPVKSSCPCNRK